MACYGRLILHLGSLYVNSRTNNRMSDVHRTLNLLLKLTPEGYIKNAQEFTEQQEFTELMKDQLVTAFDGIL